MKVSGLTLLRKTLIGTFYEKDGFLDDPVSGLRFSGEVALTLFRCPLTRCLRIALTTISEKVIAYLSFEKINWESEEAETLRSYLKCESKAYSESCVSGCRSWLDDWSEEKPIRRIHYDQDSIVKAIRASQQIEVTLNKSGIQLRSSFRPRLIDLDDEILRIAEASQTTVVFADMSRTRIHGAGQLVEISPAVA